MAFESRCFTAGYCDKMDIGNSKQENHQGLVFSSFNWRAMLTPNSIIKLTFGIGLFLLAVCFNVPVGLAQGPVLPASTSPAPEIIPGEVVVKFQDNVSVAGARNSLRAEGLRLLEVSAHDQALRVQVVPGQEATAIADLLARGDVEYATFNYRIYAAGDPSDSYYAFQWGLHNTGQTGGTPGADISASAAWDLYTGGNEVIIAMIDSGVDLDHPDLAGKITSGSQAGYNYISPTAMPNDDNGHGTHVAGIAAAVSNNNKGVAGVSWGAKIMPLKILDSAGNGETFDLAQAIRYAVDHGAKVINMSLGGSCGEGWPDVEEAVNYAASKGVILVAASGNYNTGVFCPAALNGVIAVGATDDMDFRSYYSNYGSDLDVVAPGDYIYSTLIDSNPAGLGTYGYKSGTSMATPAVAGLAALLWSYAPTLNSAHIQSVIQDSADDLGATGWDQYYGYGRINARRALEAVTIQTSPVQTYLFVDNNTGSAAGYVQLTTPGVETINWSATISPAVSWLSLAPPTSGSISAASAAQFSFTATRPTTYGQYVANVVVSGTTASGIALAPRITQVTLYYAPETRRFYFPIITHN
jgi:thermitase